MMVATLPDSLPISPLTLLCPACKAKPGKECQTSSGASLVIVHVARIAAAANLDDIAKKARKK